jgi:hypothetical protein
LGLFALALLTTPAHAERVAWTPARIGIGGGVFLPTNANYVLGEARLDVTWQYGGAAMNGNHGSGPIVGVGGMFGLGLYTPLPGETGCEDETDPDDGSKRWTCGRLTLGGSLLVGWAWGSLLKSGYVLPEKTVFVRATPYLAATKNPDHSGLDLDIQVTVGYWGSWAGVGLMWSRIPNNDYYGIGIELTKAMSEWFEDDVLVEPHAEKQQSDPPPPMRVELGGGGMYAARRNHAEEEGTGQIYLAVYRRFGNKDDGGAFTAIGGALSFFANESGGAHIGPAASIGSNNHSIGFYARVRPLIGGRTIDGSAQLDYGVDAALGLSLGIPEDDLDGGDGSDGNIGLEATAMWITGDVYVGGNVMLLAW